MSRLHLVHTGTTVLQGHVSRLISRKGEQPPPTPSYSPNHWFHSPHPSPCVDTYVVVQFRRPGTRIDLDGSDGVGTRGLGPSGGFGTRTGDGSPSNPNSLTKVTMFQSSKIGSSRPDREDKRLESWGHQGTGRPGSGRSTLVRGAGSRD